VPSTLLSEYLTYIWGNYGKIDEKKNTFELEERGFSFFLSIFLYFPHIK